jgi:hypothetical protein
MQAQGDDRLIVPENLVVSALPGGNGVLNVTALSLQQGGQGLELYAALRNDGDTPACHAALSVELFDKSEQSLAAGITGLLSQHFYRLEDDSQTIATCIGPGDISMAAVLDLGSEIALEDVAHIVYRCPYFALGVQRIAGLAITRLKRGHTYSGTLENGLPLSLANPSVSVFPLARSGRPLGMSTASAETTLAPGQTWDFETTRTDLAAPDQVAFPAGELRP